MTSAAPPTIPPQVSPPEFALTPDRPHAVPGVEVVAVALIPAGTDDATDGPTLGPGALELGDAAGVDLLEAAAVQQATGRPGEVTAVPVPLGTDDNPALRLVLLVGVGSQSPRDLRRAGAALARATRDREAVAAAVAAGTDLEGLTTFVVGLTLGSFAFHLGAGPGHRPVQRVVLAASGADDAADEAMRTGVVLGGAGWRARMLATVPSNIKNPPWLADQAEQLAAETGLTAEVWDEQRLTKEGFGGILGVGQASATPPRLIRLDYVPPKGRRAPRVVLVGKGITFDTGGLSIKPAEAMTNMKRDMTGGAVVMAVMGALRDLGCEVRVTGLVAAAENAVSGNSLRPGDVLRHYGGRTSEVTNTDAEGRLVLADGLAYAVAELDPVVVVDVATLTGAMKVALGQHTGGFFANRDELSAALLTAGEAAGEPLWRMPLVPDYEEYLASPVADADNGPRHAGAISAALFLQHFVGDVPWAHLDIASVGDAPDDRHEWTKGPTGFGVRLLLRWLTSDDPLGGIS
ncbi:hypothetical protein GCM10009623_08930 [Nocardioides aestuarii]|uniref:Probable cytosol aminopeptidase n=1 Tax=Nocardioides aestuarii TaxID=252231 RepID=A0ABW4TK22_9ACTN